MNTVPLAVPAAGAPSRHQTAAACQPRVVVLVKDMGRHEPLRMEPRAQIAKGVPPESESSFNNRRHGAVKLAFS